MGRHSEYNDEIGAEICEEIASNPISIGRMCRNNPQWPRQGTIYKWISKHDRFAEMYARAKIRQIEPLIDQIIEISDDTAHDKLIDENGKEYCNNEYIARSRLRVDSRKWLASKLVPKLYGIQKIEIGATESLLEKIVDKL